MNESEKNKKYHFVVYDDGDVAIKKQESMPIAFAMYKHNKNENDDRRRYGELFWILVDNEHQRKGIASRLIDLMIAHCGKEEGINQFRLHVLTENDAAIRLYRRLGFYKDSKKRGYPRAGHDSFRCIKTM